MITFDYSHALDFFDKREFEGFKSSLFEAHTRLHYIKERGTTDFTGWVDWPLSYDQTSEFTRIKKISQKIKQQSEIFLVIGIGGSYLGAKAGIEMLTHSFYNQLPRANRKTPAIYFLGTHLSSTYYNDFLDLIEGKDISVNVISKSGTTTEPAIGFRVIRDYLVKKYGREGARERIVVTTDPNQGALREMAFEEGYERFEIPENIGGRFSVLTAVGLLPLAVAGIDLDEILWGAKDCYDICSTPFLEANPAYQYAVLRNLFYRRGKHIELLAHYEPSLTYFAEWWKQLYGESEGKDHKGLFPASVLYTTDLHSLGQYIQQGERNLFETTLSIENSESELIFDEDCRDLDDLNFLAGISMHYVNQIAMKGTILAHKEGGVPNLVLRIPKLSPYYFGQMVYFFQKACAISSYLLGVNPFDQPGVDTYKQNMLTLLGKHEYLKANFLS